MNRLHIPNKLAMNKINNAVLIIFCYALYSYFCAVYFIIDLFALYFWFDLFVVYFFLDLFTVYFCVLFTVEIVESLTCCSDCSTVQTMTYSLA